MITINDSTNVSLPITCSRGVLTWVIETHQMDCFRNNKPSLMSDLRKELTNTFGEQVKTITGEFRNKLWVLEHNGLVYNVFSASNKGTSIEVCKTFEEIRSGVHDTHIIGFLMELHKKLI